MLNSFVGEFLVLSGSFQSAFSHAPHHFWTVLGTTGVILSAAYMLQMIQRVFYGHLGPVSDEIAPRFTFRPDLNAREHLALWPLVALMLIMGVASPYWTHTLDVNARAMTVQPLAPLTPEPGRVEAESYAKPGFVDPDLSNAAMNALDHRNQQPAKAPGGRLY